MTEQEKDKIHALRQKGLGYTAIAGKLNLSVNTVKSFCRRNMEKVVSPVVPDGPSYACKHCGKVICSIDGKRRRLFCSDACRYAHAYQTVKKKRAVCAHCGQPFAYHGKTDRRFCGHPCYIAHRYAKEKSAR